MELLILIGLWVLCGWWASVLMTNRGRSTGGGWALGLLLGIIGVVIAALLSTNREAVWDREADWRAQRIEHLHRLRDSPFDERGSPITAREQEARRTRIDRELRHLGQE